MDAINVSQVRDQQIDLVKAVIKFWVPLRAGNFLTSCTIISFSRRTLRH
jgi:hypothetical protein